MPVCTFERAAALVARRYDLRMVIATVLYPKTRESRFDFSYYLQSHIPLVKDRLQGVGLESVRLLRGMASLDGGAPLFEVIGQLTFPSMEQLQGALAQHGQEIIGDIPNFTDVQPIIQIDEPL
jgi:uncharacterized protein (TIGR02118 family)